MGADIYFDQGCGRCPLMGTPSCKVVPWNGVLTALRSVILTTDLVEHLKWGAPCYTINGKNVLMLSALKDKVVVSFFKGALLTDPKGLLVKPGPNSQAARYLVFTSLDDADKLGSALLAFMEEAIKLEISGAKIEFQDQRNAPYPTFLTDYFASNPELAEAFARLTPGRQRSYLMHFQSAKQAATQLRRIQQCTPKILMGKGWQEY
ncbi:MAG: YdeI/OmpD-associated family protein [Flavobacteriaceae bacterium]